MKPKHGILHTGFWDLDDMQIHVSSVFGCQPKCALNEFEGVLRAHLVTLWKFQSKGAPLSISSKSCICSSCSSKGWF